jgi:hypothetical protein
MAEAAITEAAVAGWVQWADLGAVPDPGVVVAVVSTSVEAEVPEAVAQAVPGKKEKRILLTFLV